MRQSAKMKQMFGKAPKVFRNSSLIYNDEIGAMVAALGFKGMLTEGAKHVLGWKSPHYVYHCSMNPNLKLLLRDFKLSDDISLRFSNSEWNEYPLFADKYINWIDALPQEELFFLKEKTLRLVIMGIGLEMIAMSLLNTDISIGISSVLLGLGLGFILPEFLVMFVKLSHHCQRGTANTTHLLATEIGISLGIATACYMELDTDKMLHTGQIVASIALLFFVLITYPYYIKKKVR